MRKKPVPPALWMALTIPVLWLAVIAASVYKNGMNVSELVSRFTSAVNHPFAVRWTAYTPRFLLVFLLLYGEPQTGAGVRLCPVGQPVAAQQKVRRQRPRK